jgi:hypothetical protein
VDDLTEFQRVALFALRRLSVAYLEGRGVRFTADEVHALSVQTVIGELASRATEESEESKGGAPCVTVP